MNKTGNNGDRSMKVKCKNWSGVINAPENSDLETISNNLSRLARIASFYYASIIHSRDKKDDGSPKTPHLHFLIWDSISTTKKGFLEFLSEQLGLEAKCISLAPSYRDSMSINYLIHANNPEKEQYAPFEIDTNNRQYIDNCLFTNKIDDDKKVQLTEKQIIELIKQDISFTGLVELLGVTDANKWRHAYRLIKLDLKEGNYKDSPIIKY